jgi:D-specific alpha-keto acid dehydrogenase
MIDAAPREQEHATTSGRDWVDVVRTLGITVYGCERDEADTFSELCPRFGVVPTIAGDAVSETSVISVPGNRCISVGHKSEISRRVLRVLKEVGVEYISTRSIGVDHIDLDAAEDVGITVENVVYAPDGVADYTLMLILMAIRGAREVVSAAERRDFRLGSVRGRDLRDMTVGVVGLGRIGDAVVRRLHGFGCRVLALDSSNSREAAADLVSLQDLLLESDVVTLHVPLNADTHHFIGREQVEMMKQGAFLINTGRGALVDTDALIVALESGKLGGAALDVLEGEEGIFYSDCTERPICNQFLLRLQALPNAIVTPHTAYYTERALYDTVEQTLVNCLNFERNRTNGEAQDRDPVRGLLGGARRVCEVRYGDRDEH